MYCENIKKKGFINSLSTDIYSDYGSSVPH